MLETVFRGIFDSDTQKVIAVDDFLLCLAVSIGIGLLFSAVYGYRSRCTRSFLLTLAILPAAVCAVIMMVNGNIGAGVAVAGAFSLVRFRSVPGSAREIGAIFLAMATGLITGMGYLAYAIVFAGLMSVMWLLCQYFVREKDGAEERDRSLRITIPEDLHYTEVFTAVFGEYTTASRLESVKTTNMGSLFRLTYRITLRDPAREQDMIDALRCHNGNLEIIMSRPEEGHDEL